MTTRKILSFDVLLKIHSNPFLVDRTSDYKKKLCKQIGREEMLYKVCDDIVDFFDYENEPETPYILAVLGELGSGKTLFARCICEQLRKRKDLFRDEQNLIPILTSSLNAES